MVEANAMSTLVALEFTSIDSSYSFYQDLVDVTSEDNLKYLLKYPYVREIQAEYLTANLASAIFLGYVEKLLIQGRDIARQELSSLLACYNSKKSGMQSGTHSQYFGHEWNPSITEEDCKIEILKKCLRTIRSNLGKGKIDLNEITTAEDEQKTIKGLKYIMVDGLKHSSRMSGEPPINIDSKEKLDLEKIRILLKECGKILMCKVTLLYISDKTLHCEQLPTLHYSGRSIVLFYSRTGSAFLYKKPPSFASEKGTPSPKKPASDLAKSGHSSGKKDKTSIHHSGLTSLAPSEIFSASFLQIPRDTYLAIESLKLVEKFYGFFQRLTEKKGTQSELNELEKFVGKYQLKLLPSELAQAGYALEKVKHVQKLLQDDVLVKKTIFSQELVETVQGNCKRCKNKKVKVIKGFGTCSCKLRLCISCMTNTFSRKGVYACPKCSTPLSQDAISLIARGGDCIFCKKSMVVLPCGDYADSVCLRERMIGFKNSQAGFKQITCCGKEIDFSVLSRVDTDLAADLSLDQFIANMHLDK